MLWGNYTVFLHLILQHITSHIADNILLLIVWPCDQYFEVQLEQGIWIAKSNAGSHHKCSNTMCKLRISIHVFESEVYESYVNTLYVATLS